MSQRDDLSFLASPGFPAFGSIDVLASTGYMGDYSFPYTNTVQVEIEKSPVIVRCIHCGKVFTQDAALQKGLCDGCGAPFDTLPDEMQDKVEEEDEMDWKIVAEQAKIHSSWISKLFGK